jgi:hypothetical protein
MSGELPLRNGQGSFSDGRDLPSEISGNGNQARNSDIMRNGDGTLAIAMVIKKRRCVYAA